MIKNTFTSEKEDGNNLSVKSNSCSLLSLTLNLAPEYLNNQSLSMHVNLVLPLRLQGSINGLLLQQ